MMGLPCLAFAPAVTILMMRDPAPRPALYVVPTSAPQSPSDGEILAALESGDARLAGALYDKVVHAVDLAIIRVLGKREPDHDDIVQAAFEQVVRSLSQKRFLGGCSLTTWASRIACHVALNTLRSRRRERRVIDHGTDVHDGRVGIASEHAAAVVDLGRVRECLARLAPEKAEALVLHDVLGHDLAEIAAITSVTVAAAQTRLSRGRRELEALMNERRRS